MVARVWIVIALAGAIGAQPVKSEPAYSAADVTVSYVSGISPTLVLGLDNNLEICLAAASPVSLEDLRARSVHVSDSQRVLLQACGILRRVGSNHQCALPVFQPPISTRIRRDAEAIAAKILAETEPTRERLIAEVSADPRAPSAYTVLGSLVFDFLVWREFESAGLLKSAHPETMTTSSKLWSGFAWIIIPPREDKFGTNVYSKGSATLLVTWSPHTLAAMQPVTPDLRDVLLEGDGSGAAPETRKALADLGLARDGKIHVGEIRAASTAHRLAVTLSREVARSFAAAFDVDAFARNTGITDRSQATLILWHEVFPEMIKRLSGEGLHAPPVLTGEAGSVLDLMILLKAEEKEGSGDGVR